jgi:hypothetical protein
MREVAEGKQAISLCPFFHSDSATVSVYTCRRALRTQPERRYDGGLAVTEDVPVAPRLAG